MKCINNRPIKCFTCTTATILVVGSTWNSFGTSAIDHLTRVSATIDILSHKREVLQEAQLAAPRIPKGVTHNKHGERTKLSRRMINGPLCPIYPSHAAIPPRSRHRSLNWPCTQCLLKHSVSLEKSSVGECGELSCAGNEWVE